MPHHRILAKYFVRDPEAVDLPALMPVFHRWIQERLVDELLIDVVDYKHVHEGPGIMLIGHEADYALDLGRGRPGLVYNRKRLLGTDRRAALRTVLHQVVYGCALLEADPTLHGSYTFRTDEIEIAFLDRLRAPNRTASLDEVRSDLDVVLAEIYGTTEIELARVEEDPRRPFTVRVQVQEAPDLATLLTRFQTEEAATDAYVS